MRATMAGPDANGVCRTRASAFPRPPRRSPSPTHPLGLPPVMVPHWTSGRGTLKRGARFLYAPALVALHGSSLRRYRKPSARVRPLRHTPVSRRIRGTQPTLTWAVDLPSFRER